MLLRCRPWGGEGAYRRLELLGSLVPTWPKGHTIAEITGVTVKFHPDMPDIDAVIKEVTGCSLLAIRISRCGMDISGGTLTKGRRRLLFVMLPVLLAAIFGGGKASSAETALERIQRTGTV